MKKILFFFLFGTLILWAAAQNKENGHLPNIPSAAEVEENGINLGEMQGKLLQKIEELTLHIIQLEKRLAEIEDKKGGE